MADVEVHSLSVGDYLDDWLAGKHRLKPKTTAVYRDAIELYLRPHIGDVRLLNLRAHHLDRMYAAITIGRRGKGLSPRTVEYVHAVLRRAFRDAVEVEQLIASNPVERAKRPRKQAKEPGSVWTPAQLRRFLTEVASRHRLHAFFHVAAYTGARRGELLNLRWSDADLGAGEIRITGTASFIDGKRVEGTTKSGRSRVVSIDPETVAVLKAHRQRQIEDRLSAGEEWRGTEDYVFTTGWGEPVHPDTVSSLMSTAPSPSILTCSVQASPVFLKR
jgi:integrase